MKNFRGLGIARFLGVAIVCGLMFSTAQAGNRIQGKPALNASERKALATLLIMQAKQKRARQASSNSGAVANQAPAKKTGGVSYR